MKSIYVYLTYEDGKSSEQLEVANPADDSEAEFQPDDEQENFINKDLEGRTVSIQTFVQVRVASAAAMLITTVSTVFLANLKIQEKI